MQPQQKIQVYHTQGLLCQVLWTLNQIKGERVSVLIILTLQIQLEKLP